MVDEIVANQKFGEGFQHDVQVTQSLSRCNSGPLRDQGLGWVRLGRAAEGVFVEQSAIDAVLFQTHTGGSLVIDTGNEAAGFHQRQ